MCNIVYIGTYNRCVKIDQKLLTVCEKMKKIQITSGGDFLTHTVESDDVHLTFYPFIVVCSVGYGSLCYHNNMFTRLLLL